MNGTRKFRRLPISSKLRSNEDAFFGFINSRVKSRGLANGVRRLMHVGNGDSVTDPMDLIDGGHYVAMDKERDGGAGVGGSHSFMEGAETIVIYVMVYADPAGSPVRTLSYPVACYRVTDISQERRVVVPRRVLDNNEALLELVQDEFKGNSALPRGVRVMYDSTLRAVKGHQLEAEGHYFVSSTELTFDDPAAPSFAAGNSTVVIFAENADSAGQGKAVRVPISAKMRATDDTFWTHINDVLSPVSRMRFFYRKEDRVRIRSPADVEEYETYIFSYRPDLDRAPGDAGANSITAIAVNNSLLLHVYCFGEPKSAKSRRVNIKKKQVDHFLDLINAEVGHVDALTQGVRVCYHVGADSMLTKVDDGADLRDGSTYLVSSTNLDVVKPSAFVPLAAGESSSRTPRGAESPRAPVVPAAAAPEMPGVEAEEAFDEAETF